MKAYVTINQQAFSKLKIVENKKIIKADLVDATIFRYVYDFSVSNKAKKMLIDNKLFVWISYQKIIDDNPLLNITSKRIIERRLNKLVKFGLLEKFTDKKQGNKTYFNITDFAYNLIIENDLSLNYGNNEPLVPKSTNLSTQEYEPLVPKSTNLSTQEYDNRKLNKKLKIDSYIEEKKEKKYIKKEKRNNFFKNDEIQQLLEELKVDEEFLNELIEYRKAIKKPLNTTRGVKGVLKAIRDTFIETGISPTELFEIMAENEWQTIKTAYLKNNSNNNNNNNKKRSITETNQETIKKVLEVFEDIDEDKSFMESNHFVNFLLEENKKTLEEVQKLYKQMHQDD